MKTTKCITLDLDIAERLKDEQNASALIESLLREHFRISGYLTIEQKKARIAELELMEKHKKELDDLKHGRTTEA